MSWSDGWSGRGDDAGDASGGNAPARGARTGRERSFHLRRRGGGRVRDWLTHPPMLGVLLLTVSYLSILAHVTDVVGGTEFLIVEVVAVLVAATLVAALLDLRAAMVVSVGLLVGGLGVYYLSIPESQRALVSLGSTVNDLGALLTGLSVLRLVQAKIWVYAVVPAPLFASWILALRGRYAQSVLIGGGVLGFFILTGNADTVTTLLGVVGATAAVGLGELDPRGALEAQWDTVVLVVVVMIVVSASISLVPGGSAEPLFFGDGTQTLEANLVDSSERVSVLGSIRLSPKVRFTVESDQPSYWRVGGYDRFTGDSWVRTGESQPYSGELQGPPGESRRLVQNVTAVTPLNALPAAWKPVGVDSDIAGDTEVSRQGGLRTSDALGENETYTVVSEMPRHTRETLRDAGDDYPGAVENRYLQLPESTPDRVGEQTQQVVDEANATTAYDKAVAIERYLESNKRYSLNVQRPDGNIADKFLFEMDAGYCTYYATTMVVMLRTQGIPARFVTGYTTGERVAQDEWVVRGTNAHAWVEIYFPDVGWVAFDPTPGGPRQTVENQRIAEARESGAEGVDTGDSGPDEWTPTPTPTPNTTEPTANGTAGNPGNIPGAGNRTPPDGPLAGGDNFGTVGTINATSPGGQGGFEMPTRKELGYGFALLLGFLAAGRRFGVDRRLYRFVWLRYQPRTDPVADVERAYDRLEMLLRERHRPRRRGETPNDYVDNLVGVDPRARQVVRLYELAHYRRSVTEAQADRAVRLVDGMVGETTPVVGRLRRAVGRST